MRAIHLPLLPLQRPELRIAFPCDDVIMWNGVMLPNSQDSYVFFIYNVSSTPQWRHINVDNNGPRWHIFLFLLSLRFPSMIFFLRCTNVLVWISSIFFSFCIAETVVMWHNLIRMKPPLLTPGTSLANEAPVMLLITTLHLGTPIPAVIPLLHMYKIAGNSIRYSIAYLSKIKY